jgi:hypothetical protein
MSRRHSRSPRSKKSQNAATTPSEVESIVPPSSVVASNESAKPLPDPQTLELAAIEADWDELLVGNL